MKNHNGYIKGNLGVNKKKIKIFLLRGYRWQGIYTKKICLTCKRFKSGEKC